MTLRRLQARKFQAFHAHASQLPLMQNFQQNFESRAGTEVYTLAARPSPTTP